MDRLPVLDLAVLRSLVATIDLGGHGRAATSLGCAPSTVSLQLRGLEAQLGARLFRKQGRGVAPTQTGEALVAYARRLLELNDEAMIALKGQRLAGELRFGLPQDLAPLWLPTALARFARAHPAVRIEIRVDHNRGLLDAVGAGGLDLAIVFARDADGDEDRLARVPTEWIGRRGDSLPDADSVLPLALFDPPCLFRQIALGALEQAQRAWRITASSSSPAGLWATVEAGLALTARTRLGLPTTLVPIEIGLPALPAVAITMRTGGNPSAARTRLGDELRATAEAMTRTTTSRAA